MGPVEKARRLRGSMSPAEVRLWQVLRTRPNGFQFRRQRPTNGYTIDFFCRPAALAIEVDGNAHDMGDNPMRDMKRDAEMARSGIKTVRIPASEVFNNLENVLIWILEECASRTPSTG